MENQVLWEKCLKKLEDEIEDHDFNMWVRPLSAINDDASFKLYAPNRFIKDWLDENLLDQLAATIRHFTGADKTISIELDNSGSTTLDLVAQPLVKERQKKPAPFGTNVLNTVFTFENHIEGNSNRMARAATKLVSENPGNAYNPLFIFGGVGLGKTHLMHAAGNLIKRNNSNAVVAYVHSERFVSDMVKSISNNAMDKFKSYYRSLDALLIDDIQFFAGKNQSQEEFFHTFNTLLETGGQIILTSDKFPKDINNLQERLVSRFESGLTVRIDRQSWKLEWLSSKIRRVKTVSN